MDEHKMVKVEMNGEVIAITFDGNQDGQPSAKLEIYGKEALEEIIGGVMGLIKKK